MKIAFDKIFAFIKRQMANLSIINIHIPLSVFNIHIFSIPVTY